MHATRVIPNVEGAPHLECGRAMQSGRPADLSQFCNADIDPLAASDQIASFLKSLEGSFAFGHRFPNGVALMCVDRFARSTLCYAIRDGRVSFAGRADQLAGPDRRIDLQAVFDYLFFHVIPSPRTIFQGVHRLPAAHYALVSGSEAHVRPYWSPSDADIPAAAAFSDMKLSFRKLLKEAVLAELDGGKPGCFLSGGTDSSTIAGVIREVTGRAPSTYSIGFDAPGYDEMQFARIAASHFGTDHHEYYVTPDDLVKSIADVAGWYDQPFGNSSALPAYYCAKMAGDDGVTRMLAGDGGDELFGGNARYAKQQVFDAYAKVPLRLRSSIIEPLFLNRSNSRLALLRKASSYVEQARRPMPERTHLYNLLLRLGIDAVLEPGFAHQIDPGGPAREEKRVWDAPDLSSTLDRTLAFDWRYTLAECDLPKVRESCALAGIDVGFPMLNEGLLALSQRLPNDWKVRRRDLRWFFKQALRDFLPSAIIEKKKKGFGLPFGVWTTQHKPLLSLAKDSLTSFGTRGVVRPTFIRTLLKTKLYEHPGYFGEMVWILLVLEQWLRKNAPDFAVAT
ncbi:MAG: asparagine synthase C-terminal domain-containing protein [Burkholderiaceae bacterium]